MSRMVFSDSIGALTKINSVNGSYSLFYVIWKKNTHTRNKNLWYLLGRNGCLKKWRTEKSKYLPWSTASHFEKGFYVVCETNKQCLKSLISIQMVSEWAGQGGASVVNHLSLEGPRWETWWCLYKSIGTWEKEC